MYTFTNKKSLIDFYSNLIHKDKLYDLIKEIEAEPFKEREGEGKLKKLQKLKRLEWRLNKAIKENPDIRLELFQ